MAVTPDTVKRIARMLETLSESTPKGAGFWDHLAQRAAEEASRTITMTTGMLPSQVFLAVVPGRESLHVLARGTALMDLLMPAEEYLQVEGSGEVWALEVRRVLTVG